MKGMLDTSVLIGAIPAEIIDDIDDFGASFFVRAELARGLRRLEGSSEPGRARMRGQLISALDDLPDFWHAFGASESEAYSSLTAASEAAVRSKVAFIAAHAVAQEVPLFTRDAGFTRFDGLDVRLA